MHDPGPARSVGPGPMRENDAHLLRAHCQPLFPGSQNERNRTMTFKEVMSLIVTCQEAIVRLQLGSRLLGFVMQHAPAIFIAGDPALDFLNSVATPVDVPVEW